MHSMHAHFSTRMVYMNALSLIKNYLTSSLNSLKLRKTTVFYQKLFLSLSICQRKSNFWYSYLVVNFLRERWREKRERGAERGTVHACDRKWREGREMCMHLSGCAVNSTLFCSYVSCLNYYSRTALISVLEMYLEESSKHGWAR